MEGGECHVPFYVTKRLTFPSGDLALKVEYEVRNDGTKLFGRAVRFGVEPDAPGGGQPRPVLFRRREADWIDPRLCVARARTDAVSRAGMLDRWLGLNVAFETPTTPGRFLRYPVETVSQLRRRLRAGVPGFLSSCGVGTCMLAPDETAKP
jgi:hypothetical protein